MDILSFKNAIKGITGLNRYRITINNKYLNEIPYTFMAREVTLPGQQIIMTSINIQGSNRNVAAGMDYDPVSITFICDEAMSSRNAIEKWQRDIFDKETYTISFLDDYKANILIEVLDKRGDIVHTILVRDAWPKDISDISLGYDNNDQVMEFTVNFEHFSWINLE